MAEHVLNDFKSEIQTDGSVKFSFKLEDKGPEVAWKGPKPVVSAAAKVSSFGELIIEGTITEAPAEPEKPTEESAT